MDDPAEIRRLRVRHALRCAIGGTAVATVGLTTSTFNGCFGSVIFFISTIAGTPHVYQGFQLRSISLVCTGAITGLLSYALVVVIANTNRRASFFLTLPFIAIFSLLRADASLVPMPSVANVTLGLLLISRIDDGRAKLPQNMLSFFIEIVISWALATAVNLIFPDRAADIGRRLIARELRRLGSSISSVGSNAFRPPAPSLDRQPSHESRLAGDSERHEPLHMSDWSMYIDTHTQSHQRSFTSNSMPFTFGVEHRNLEVTSDMVRAAAASLHFLRQLPPFGSTRVSDYAGLADAHTLLESSSFEPRLLPEAASRWRNVAAWRDVVDSVNALVTKVSCLESVVHLHNELNEKFDQAEFANFLGQAYIPLWVFHLASCAASCAAMSQLMCYATCEQLRSSSHRHGGIDPTKWRARRAEMYFGFLWHTRLSARNEARVEGRMQYKEMRNLEPPSISPLDLHYNVCKPRNNSMRGSDKGRTMRSKDSHDDHAPKTGTSSLDVSQRRSLSFFAIECHALAEQIGHVQQAMSALASTSDAQGWLAPFYFLICPFPAIRERIQVIASMRMPSWEVQFAFTHWLLLTCVLGFAMFLPLDRFEESEIAWAFTSAALAAQLSAEPTLFIGIWRVLATITGATLGYGFSSFLKAVDRDSNSRIYLWAIPYLFAATVICLLLVPSSHRYAAFLIILTNAIMLLCPRSTAGCSRISSSNDSDCFPDWKYAISRSANVSIGVVFAVVFHLLFWPRYANDVVLRKLTTALKNGIRVMHALRVTYFSLGLEQPETKPKQKARNENEEHITLLIDLDSEVDATTEYNIFQNTPLLVQEVQSKVGKFVSTAAQTVKSEASLFSVGPLRHRPLLSELLPDFIALNVTLSEMAALLGRRPVFSPSYGRSVFDKLIRPMLAEYETIQVSLNNLVSTSNETIRCGPRQKTALRENALDLYQALTHLARCRSNLRRGVCERAASIGQLGALDVNVRRRLSHWSLSLDEQQRGGFSTDAYHHTKHSAAFSKAMDDFSVSDSAKRLHIDDMIMYDAFTFIAEASLSAFVRIASTILEDTELKLQSKNIDRKEQ